MSTTTHTFLSTMVNVYVSVSVGNAPLIPVGPRYQHPDQMMQPFGAQIEVHNGLLSIGVRGWVVRKNGSLGTRMSLAEWGQDAGALDDMQPIEDAPDWVKAILDDAPAEIRAAATDYYGALRE